MEQKVIASNKGAGHKYEIIEKIEAGIELKGSEVKSLRSHKVDLKDSFARIQNGEVYLHNLYISPYEKATYDVVEPRRVRKLLLHRREINKLVGKVQQQGYTVVALKLYFSERGKAKVLLAVAKGRKLYDQRQKIAKKETEVRLQKIKRIRNVH